MKSMLQAKAIAETPKKKPDGEYCSDFEPVVTYTAQSSYAQSNPTARSSKKATAPANMNQIKRYSEVTGHDIINTTEGH